MPKQVTDLFGRISFHPGAKYNAMNTTKNFADPLNFGKLTEVRFEATATYSPLAYVPQSIGREGVGRLSRLCLWCSNSSLEGLRTWPLGWRSYTWRFSSHSFRQVGLICGCTHTHVAI